MNALVVGSGKIESIAIFMETVRKSQLFICADGGAHYFQNAGILPDVLIGDFDSIEPDSLKAYENAGVEIVKYSPYKDYTDMELALDYAIKRGVNRIFIMGATGTRLDHTLSNLQLLHKLLDAGVEGILIDNHNMVYLIEDSIQIQRKEGYKISLIPATPVVEGITTTGLVYPLAEAVMTIGTGLGVSNEFISDEAGVRVLKGRLFVVLSKD